MARVASASGSKHLDGSRNRLVITEAIYNALVPKDEKAALKLLQKGAGAGDAGALYNLGICYAAGVGVRKNNVEAYRYIYAAKARGYDGKEALTNLESDMTAPEIDRARLLAKPYIAKEKP